MRLFRIVLAAGLCFCVAGLASAQEMTMPELGAPQQMKDLAWMDGNYNVEVKVRMAPDQDWMMSQAQAEVEHILDGCVQKMMFKGSMMGMPLHGLATVTYNRSTGEYQQTWVDNFMAALSVYSGKMNEAGEIVCEGVDQYEGQDVHIRATTYDMGDGKWKWKMEQSMDGGKSYFESMHLAYTPAS